MPKQLFLILSAILCVCLFAACDDDDDGDTVDTETGNDTGNDTGTEPDDTGNDTGTEGGDTGTEGGDTGTGDEPVMCNGVECPGDTTGMGILTPCCSPSGECSYIGPTTGGECPDPPEPVTCGGVECELVEGLLAIIIKGCCSPTDKCSYQDLSATECPEPAVESDQCEEADLQGNKAPGCCASDGTCGGLILDAYCLSTVMTGATPVACTSGGDAGV